jgi:hypothetical protein
MKKLPALCMFCGGDESFGPMNVEHFVPLCLWNGARPEKTRVCPAHKECNRKFSNDNEYFRDVMAMSAASSNHPEAVAIVNGPITRAIKRKKGSAFALVRDALPVTEVTLEGAAIRAGLASPVDMERIERVLQNITRGVWFQRNKCPLPQNIRVHAGPVNGTTWPAYQPLIKLMTGWSGFGDDVFAFQAAVDQERPERIAILMQFYRNQIFLCLTWPADTAWDATVTQPNE